MIRRRFAAMVAAGSASLVMVLAMPIGIALAVLLERTDLPARNACRLLLLPMMWLPAEVTAIQWQNLLTLAIPG